MKKPIVQICVFLWILFPLLSHAQQTIIKGKFASITEGEVTLDIPNNFYALSEGESPKHIDKPIYTNGEFVFELDIKEPQIMRLIFNDGPFSFFYNLYLSPGDNILLNIDASFKAENIKVSGKGMSNNQFLKINYFDDSEFYTDSLPNRVCKEIKRVESEQKAALQEYIKKHNPSKDFIKTWQTNLSYFAPQAYFNFEQNNKFQIFDAYEKYADKWKMCRDELFASIAISNDEALNCPTYKLFVDDFLNRTKEELWKESKKNPDQFYKDWYNTSAEKGQSLFKADETNLLTEKIIKKYFRGKAANFAYSVLFYNAAENENFVNLPQIFDNYKTQFPQSKYLPSIELLIAKITARQKNTLTDKISFVTNGESLKTFEEVINQFKGKTVLLDMWGTWCTPCRSEIDQNNEALKKHFTGTELEFVYVANYDTPHPDKWKNMIAYYNMEGSHILANNELTKDILKKTKGTEFPTYIIIKRDGSYELSKAGLPMQREVLINQLESALALPSSSHTRKE